MKIIDPAHLLKAFFVLVRAGTCVCRLAALAAESGFDAEVENDVAHHAVSVGFGAEHILHSAPLLLQLVLDQRGAYPLPLAEQSVQDPKLPNNVVHCNIFGAWHNSRMQVGDVSVLIIDENRTRAAIIEDGLRGAGHQMVSVISDMKGVVRQIEDIAPDVIVMDLGIPNRDFLEHMFRVSKTSGKPVAMFVDRSDDEAMRAAVEAGVSAYVVDGLKKDRIKPILDLAILRFRAFEQLRAERDKALQALDERKNLDRAKGIIMQLRGVSEEQAYTLLRETAMNQGKRIADIAMAVIASAELLHGGDT